MKPRLLLWAASLLLLSCESEGEFTRTEVGAIPVAPTSFLKYSGTFSPTSGITAQGSANIYQDGNSFKVALQDFSISAGPDLKVYLSTTAAPDTFINLGALGNGMTQTYAIPDGVDFNLYDHVLIHCQQYHHLYAIAPLHPVN